MKVLFTAFIIFIFLLSTDASATLIKLTSGRIINGEIVDISNQGVKIESGRREYTIPESLILDKDILMLWKNTTSLTNEAITIELFSTPWCPYCKKYETLLKSRNVKFTEFDIEEDPSAAQRLHSLVGDYDGVPIIKIGSFVIKGYDPERVLTLLKQYNLIPKPE